MGLSRQGYWSGLPCPPPGGLYWATREAHVCEREQVNKREWVRVTKQLHFCICPIPALWLCIFQRALFPFIGECFYCILGLLIGMSIIASSPLSRQSKEIHVFIPTHAYTHIDTSVSIYIMALARRKWGSKLKRMFYLCDFSVHLKLNICKKYLESRM